VLERVAKAKTFTICFLGSQTALPPNAARRTLNGRPNSLSEDFWRQPAKPALRAVPGSGTRDSSRRDACTEAQMCFRTQAWRDRQFGSGPSMTGEDGTSSSILVPMNSRADVRTDARADGARCAGRAALGILNGNHPARVVLAIAIRPGGHLARRGLPGATIAADPRSVTDDRSAAAARSRSKSSSSRLARR